MAIAMPKFLRRKPQHKRFFKRFSCQIDTHLMLIDRMFQFEGRIIDISQGGALFRPRLAYIMYRADAPVCIQIGSEELFGHIVTTSTAGFNIRFDEPIDEEDLTDFLAEFDKTPKDKALQKAA